MPSALPRTARIALGAALLGAAAVALYLAAAGGLVGGPSIFLVGAALVLGEVVYLLARSGLSLVREPETEEVQLATGRRRKELEREKQGLLKALKELEFDHEMRKISDRDYHEIAALYRGRAIQILKRLDEQGLDYRKLIDKDLAVRLGKAPAAEAGVAAPASSPVGAPAAEDVARAKAAALASDDVTSGFEAVASGLAPPEGVAPAAAAPLDEDTAGADRSPRACPACRTANDPDALFCKRCGQRFLVEGIP